MHFELFPPLCIKQVEFHGLSGPTGPYPDTPEDPILNFVNSQCNTTEELDMALQAYQASSSQNLYCIS